MPYAEDGTTTGDKIPGSEYYRAFCAVCNSAIRVSKENAQTKVMNFCESCDNYAPLKLPAASKTKKDWRPEGE